MTSSFVRKIIEERGLSAFGDRLSAGTPVQTMFSLCQYIPLAEGRQPNADSRFFPHTAAVCRSLAKCQISRAYSTIVRSLENLPMRATLSIARRDQFSRSLKSR